MGDHRAEPPATGRPTLSEPVLAPRPGRRRADVPIDLGPSPATSVPTPGQRTPYVGRRVAVLDRVETPEVVTPEVVPPVDLGEDTIERVLGALEPVDHTTSFEHEPTERLPLIRVGQPAPSVDAPVRAPARSPIEASVPPAVQIAGRRRAAKRATRRPPILKAMPSVPVLLGLAALAASVGGTLAVHDTSSASADTTTSLRPASALSGTSAIGHVGGRGGLVTRDADREAQSRSAAGVPLAAAANGLAEQRNSLLEKYNRQSTAYSRVLKSNQWITPVTPGVYHLTARFGQYGLWASFHTGLDFAAPTGTPIHAIASGTVIFAQYDGAYGNKTIVRLADGTEIWYCHQNEFATAVGDTVTQGETIGYVGSTGHTTGPHVHVEVHPGGGDPVDPYPAFQQHGITP